MKDTGKESRNRGTKSNPETDIVLKWLDMPELIRDSVEALRDKKVEEIRVYDLRNFTPYLDFVVLGTVYSAAQAHVAKEIITQALRKHDLKVYGVEGEEDSGWLLIDFWDIVVHLFRPETRQYYNLEALWADLPWWPGETID